MTEVFGAILIASNPQRARILEEASLESGAILALRVLESYPTGAQLTQLFNALDPELLLLDAADAAAASLCAGVASSHSNKVGVMATAEEEALARLASDQLFPVLLPFPPLPPTMAKAVDDVVHSRRCPVEPAMVSFLPAKAGSGASTVAFQTAHALSALGRKVILIEADLRSGVLASMAAVKVERCIQELLKSGGEMDTFRFNNAVIAPYTGPHLLLSSEACTAAPYLPAWEDYFRLLEILRTRYDHILVDLPELVNPGTRELVQRSRFVFTVATPELLSLELAGRRMRELAAWRVPNERIRVLLNRFQRGGLNSAEVAKHLDCTVAQVFPNDYPEVNRAVGLGAPVPAHTALGQRFADFAASLVDARPPLPEGVAPLSKLLRRLVGPRTPHSDAAGGRVSQSRT